MSLIDLTHIGKIDSVGAVQVFGLARRAPRPRLHRPARSAPPAGSWQLDQLWRIPSGFSN